uniref:Alpha-S1-casein n=1 Tax=Prolemur simus TaxID=1328070 RepID=A0A8C9A2F0_PROSS
MKLLILACLVAVALARPKHPLRHPELVQNQPDSSEATPIELRQEYTNELNRQKQHQGEKQSEEIKETSDESTEEHAITETEQKESSSSSSSEEQPRRMSKCNQLQVEAAHAQEQLSSMNEYNHAQVPFPQVYQLDATWYYFPQIMQDASFLPSQANSKPTSSENNEKTNAMAQW